MHSVVIDFVVEKQLFAIFVIKKKIFYVRIVSADNWVKSKQFQALYIGDCASKNCETSNAAAHEW